MAEIDSLLIDITANSTKAQTALDGLATGLERMQQSLNGVNAGNLNRIANGMRNVATAMQSISGIDKRSFTALADKFNQLNNINNANLVQSAATIQQIANAFSGLNGIALNSSGNIATLVSAISSLGNGRIITATQNLPALAVALRNLFTTLSTAPNVSSNVISMTNALANLANQGQRVSSATRGLNNALNNSTRATRTANSNFKSLASTIGKFYATYFLVIRGIKNLWKSIESSMDYTETFNYWSVSLDKIKKEYGSNWQQWTEYYSEMGIDSAEAYADSFESRLKELVKKMSGNTIGESGELLIGDNIGLGLDAEQLLNFQAKILGVTNSVGVLGETSINTAKALSMLSGDLSSLTNEDISTVMQNLQSGLIGQSRALYKYGIDITDATLKTIALEHGIKTATSAMSQSEKMQLRVLAILQQSKVAWGDQANTLNSVANMYRVFQQQVSNLSRILGNLFMPIIQKVLPYVNAVVIVLQRLFTLLGFKLWGDSWLKDIQAGISGGAGTIGEEVEDLGNTISNTADEAKKLKKQLQGFDELNNLSSNDDSSGGSGAIGKGFDLSLDIADALKEYEKVWNEALSKAKSKSEEIANAIMSALNKLKQSDFYKSMEKLFGTLKQLTQISFKALTDFYDKFLKPVAKWVGNKVVKKLVDLFTDFVKKIKWDWLLKTLSTLWQVLSKFTTNIGQGLLDFFSIIAKFALSALATVINVIAVALNVLLQGLLDIPAGVLQAIGVALGSIFAVLLAPSIASTCVEIGTAFVGFATKITGAIESLGAFVALNPTIVWAAVIVAALAGLVIAIEKVQEDIDRFSIEAITNAMSGEVSIKEYSDAIVNDFNNISQGFKDLQSSVDEIKGVQSEIDDTAESIKTLFTAFDSGFEVEEKLNTLVGYFRQFFEDSKVEFEKVYLMIVASTTGAFDEATNAEAKAKYDAYMEELTGMAVAKIEDFNGALAQIEEIEKQINSGDMTNEQALQAFKDIAEQFGIISSIDATAAANSLEKFKGALDFNEILTDGQFDEEKFKALTENLSTAYTEGTDVIKTATAETKQIVDDWLTSLGASEDMKLFFANIYDEKEKAALEEYNSKITEFTDNFSTQLLERVPQIVSNAESEYANLKWWEKLFTPKDNFVSSTLAKFEGQTIKPFIEGLNSLVESTTQDKTKDYSWVSDAYVDMFNNAFDLASTALVDSPHEAQVVDALSLSLKDDWQEKMQEVSDKYLCPKMGEIANATLDAFDDTIRGGGRGGSAFDELAVCLSDAADGRKDIFTAIGSFIGETIIDGLINKISNIQLGSIKMTGGGGGTFELQQYATGGFPKDDSLFMANSSEIVGKFSNGKTVVANNDQIEKGIANAVYNAITSAGGFGGGNVSIRLEGDAKGLFRAVQEGATDYTNRTGQPAFLY